MRTDMIFPDRNSGKKKIVSYLRQRGYELLSGNDPEIISLLDSKNLDSFYNLMKKYSFRLFFRDLILKGKSFPLKGRKFYSSEKASQYLSSVVEIFPERWIKSIRYKNSENMGGLMEWFIEELLFREFSICSLRNIRLRNSSIGGDFDIISLVEDKLMTIEVKSSPPKHIHKQEVVAFLKRLAGFGPSYALFIEDTHLRMKDKLVVLFTEAVEELIGKRENFERLEGEIFTLDHSLAIVNSKPDIVHNIRLALRYLLMGSSPFLNFRTYHFKDI